jgi:hypothetical protein
MSATFSPRSRLAIITASAVIGWASLASVAEAAILMMH